MLRRKVGSASLRIRWRRLACTAATTCFALLDGFLLSGAGGVARQSDRLVNCLVQLFKTCFSKREVFLPEGRRSVQVDDVPG